MSRLYLIILLFMNFSLGAQEDLKGMIKFADEQFKKGDLFYAIDTYQKILGFDSTNNEIHWNYAESLRLYKDYEKAEKEYAYVKRNDSTLQFPNSSLYLGLMLKQNGKYDDAIVTFKVAKKEYMKDRKGYPYIKSKHEIESCLWAKSELKNKKKVIIEKLDTNINSTNAEFGGTFNDDSFYFTSLKADSVLNEEVYDPIYTTSIYKSKVNNTKFEKADSLELNKKNGEYFGNGSFSLDSQRFYYSKCKPTATNFDCVIMVSKKQDDKWLVGDTLGEIINLPNTNTTMPHITLFENQETLFFCSDREGTKGGLDIWYSSIKNGNQFSKVRPVKAINSIENEVSPWFDTTSNQLYFSSNWYNNFGGYDVFQSSYDAQFQKPENLGAPINGAANDLYYFAVKDTFYLSSNRIGVYHTSNPTCCSDIFKGYPVPEIVDSTTRKTETLAQLMQRLPVTIYFHNDIPNPKSTATTSEVNYIDSYNEYAKMLEEYKTEYSKGLKGDLIEEAKEDISDFFLEYVDQGVKDLEQFRDLLLIELQKGNQFNLYIKGFASPLAKSDYNVNLTKRRIASLINYLVAYENGIFKPFINGTASNGGKVVFNEIPFGENVANKLTSDNPNDKKNSIYSRAAAVERKIEIQSIKYIELTIKDSLSIATDKQIVDLGKIKKGTTSTAVYYIKNTGNKTIEIDTVDIPCDCNEVKIEKMILKANEETKVEVRFDSTNYKDKIVKSVYIHVINQTDKLRLVMTTVVEE